MADNDQDTPQPNSEGQGEGLPKPAAAPPPEPKDASPAPIADDFAPKQGETVEQYAARMRKEVDWRDKQMGRQHRQKKEADERAAKFADIEAENQRLKQLVESGSKKAKEPEPAPAPAPRAPAVTGDPKAQARFEVQVENLSAELLEKHADEWRSAHANFERIGGVQPEFLSAVLDTDDPAYVMLKLGKDMGEYTRIMALPEGRRRAALIKLGMESAQQPPPKSDAKKPSGAPAPKAAEALPPGSMTPQGEGLVPDQDDRAPMPPPGEFPKDKYRGEEYDSAWYAARKKQKLESQGRPWSVGGGRKV